jgi:hypothetical protein
VRREDFEVEAVGEIVLEDKTLVIERITVTYRLRGVPDDRREEVERVHGFHPRSARWPGASTAGSTCARSSSSRDPSG